MQLPDRMAIAWERRSLKARRIDRDLTATERSIEWDDCVESLRQTFAAYYGDDAVAARLDIPDDYATFMQQIGGGWEWTAGLGSRRCWIKR